MTGIPARLSFVTLAVRDMPRMQRFYDQLGWPKSKFSDDTFAAYRCGGAVLGLYGAENYEKAYGAPPPAGSFRGFVLALNCRDAAEVDRTYASMKGLDGIRLGREPQDLSFGGRGFEWRDPEDNVWEVTWAEGTSFDEREALIFP
ncbi:MAG TPA: VOC family protein [Candidatus Limnocylindria bacterium]|nr:VOC family protein [Candidatus Limnocylindria bacterium]